MGNIVRRPRLVGGAFPVVTVTCSCGRCTRWCACGGARSYASRRLSALGGTTSSGGCSLVFCPTLGTDRSTEGRPSARWLNVKGGSASCSRRRFSKGRNCKASGYVRVRGNSSGGLTSSGGATCTRPARSGGGAVSLAVHRAPSPCVAPTG